MTKIYIGILFLFFNIGCEIKEQNKIDSANKDFKSKNTMQQKSFKGMYNYFEDAPTLTECSSKKKYLISDKGDNAGLVKAFVENKNSSNKIYIEAEGFLSELSNREGTGFDTVLVITRFIKSDEDVNCD